MQSRLRRVSLFSTVDLALSFAHAVLPYSPSWAVRLSLREAHRLPASRSLPDSTSGEVSGRLAAPLKLPPNGGHIQCLALCLRHSGTVIEQVQSAACGFVSWSNAAYHAPRTPCPCCRGFSERQRRASLGNTSQNAARRVSVCCMHDEQVGSGLALTELNVLSSEQTEDVCEQ